MNIEALNCRCCGGILKVNSALCVCEYCGATNFVSDTAGKYINQLNRANKLRQEKEYDNALRIYDNILSENVATPDILWLRTLCEYGIEYVPDPVSSKYFPTLHRVKDESILNYHSYLEALELCDDEQKKVLRVEAEEINRIQTEYLEIAKNESPYDVFICYKETDDESKTVTEDVAYATKLYNCLTRAGFKVFFARETLKEKLSVDYEPYIFAALKSSRAMAVIGSKSEYFTAIWVKNEWSRFLKLMEKDSKKQMFFACDDPEELPRAFSLKQAQLLSDQNAMENMADNIIRFLNESKSPRKEIKKIVKTISEPLTREEMYNKALKSLKVGNYPAALSMLDDLHQRYPEEAEAYWLQTLANLRHNPDNIIYCKRDLTRDKDYQKAISLANENEKARYTEIKDKCLENLRLQNEFNSLMDKFAESYKHNINSSEEYRRRGILINELAELAEDDSRTAGAFKAKKQKLRAEMGKRVSEIDRLSKIVLEDLQRKAIVNFREFKQKYNLPDKIEIDMESVSYKALRKEIIEENDMIKDMYGSGTARFPDGELNSSVRNGNDDYIDNFKDNAEIRVDFMDYAESIFNDVSKLSGHHDDF